MMGFLPTKIEKASMYVLGMVHFARRKILPTEMKDICTNGAFADDWL